MFIARSFTRIFLIFLHIFKLMTGIGKRTKTLQACEEYEITPMQLDDKDKVQDIFQVKIGIRKSGSL